MHNILKLPFGSKSMASSSEQEARFWINYIELAKTLRRMSECVNGDPDKLDFQRMVNDAFIEASGMHLGADLSGETRASSPAAGAN